MFSGMTLETIRLAVKNIHLHKLRSFLTTLGIIFGVGAVICMLSITEGASQAELALIRLLGTQNIILRSVKPQGSEESSAARSRMLEYGLTRKDLELISGTIPEVQRVAALREVAFEVVHGAKRFPATVVGADPVFFDVIHVDLTSGTHLQAIHQERRAKVCVIGADVASVLFAFEDPIGRTISVDSVGSGVIPYEVIGVMAPVLTAGTPAKGLASRDLNSDVFIPLSTADARYSVETIRRGSGTFEASRIEFSDFYVEVSSLDHVLSVAKMLEQALNFRHTQPDYAIQVPLERLRIAESEKRRRRITLGCIAGISLLVGGIGIMNIMLAGVTERTREIGVRRALGARRRHITVQFLMEAVVLTTVGGVIGVVAGCLGAWGITQYVGWPTVIQLWTVGISFGLAVAVGVFFGIYPAASAARLDPIEALRHE